MLEKGWLDPGTAGWPREGAPPSEGRLEDFLLMLARMASGEFQKRLPISPQRDVLDAIAFGVNMLSGELQFTSVSLRSLEAVIDAVADALVVIDLSGSVELANRAARDLFLVSNPTPLVGACFGDRLGESHEFFAQAVRDLERFGSVGQLNWTLSEGGGRPPIPLSVNAALIPASGGSTSTGGGRIVLVARDMRESRRLLQLSAEAAVERRRSETLMKARDSAEAASRAKNDWLATVSHELRTPLTLMLGHLQLLERPELLGPGGDERSCVEGIGTSARTLLKLVEDLLDFSRIEAGALILHASRLAPREFGRQVLQEFASVAAVKGLAVALDCETDCPECVETDPLRLRQVLNNLISNAVKFTASGTVRIRIRARGGLGVEFDVEDTGCGVPDGVRARLFTAFYQGEAGVSREFGGSGLGLALSRRLARAMGGDVELAWTQPGRGSTFRFWVPASLPRSSDADCVGAAASLSFESPGSAPVFSEKETGGVSLLSRGTRLSGLRILMVEDEPEIASLLSQVLTSVGAVVSHLATGEEAVSLHGQGRDPLDCILMDFRLAGRLDGIETTRRLRAGGFAGAIIGISADAVPEKVSTARAAGCDAIVAKPMDFAELIGLLADLPRSRK